MRLDELLRGQPVRLVRGSETQVIDGIAEDSRAVVPGGLFIARRGTAFDGRAYIPDAVARGAVAVLTDDPERVPADVAALFADDVPLATALLAERWNGHPSAELKLIGITGTNGKTTTAYLVRQILLHAGFRCGLMGTVEVDDGRGRTPSRLTTPSAIETSGLLATMVDHGCRACVMEVSSHALDQKRVAALSYDAAVFTNLTGDHMDYHASFEAYRDAKAMLFEMLAPDGCAVVNGADEASEAMRSASPAPVVSTAADGSPADATATIIDRALGGMRLRLVGGWGEIDTLVALVGEHNASNVVQAAAVAHALGVDRDTLAGAIASCTAPPGRLEPVTQPQDDIAVLVDYAHTDDALDNVLAALRPIVPDGGRLRVVFGCGGDRDRSKRPRMASVACARADEVIVTSDNPRTEDPDAIVADVLEGIPATRRDDTVALVDREEAIAHAVETARGGDVVVIAGKGHEPYQIVGHETRPFDDRVIASRAIAARREGGRTP